MPNSERLTGSQPLREPAQPGTAGAKLALAERLLSHEPYDVVQGYRLALEAAAEGSGAAQHLLAVATAEGLGAPLSFEGALDHLQRSAELGHAPARAELAALAGDWSPSDAADWTQSKRNWSVLRRSLDARVWLRIPPPQIVCAAPRIAVIERFASPEICRWLIERARPGLAPAQTINAETGKGQYEATVRTNSSFGFDVAHMDMVLVLMRARISRLTQLPIAGFEDSQVLHYAPGEEFKPHFDFLDVSSPGHAAAVASGGQRVATFLMYLNEGYDGGETVFPTYGWTFKGRTGDAVLFYNTTPEGAPDRRTLHAGAPTTNGEKFLLSQWIRARVSGQ